MTATNQVFTDLAAFLKRAAALGEQQGKGELARPEFAVNLAIAASEGHVTPDDAGKAWAAFASKSRKATDGNVPDLAGSDRIRSSECKTLVTVAMLPSVDLADTFKRARPIIAGGKAEGVKGSAWDNFLKIARYHMKNKIEGRNLTDDEIRAAMAGEAKEAKDEIATLKALEKSMTGIYEGKEGTDTSPGKPAFASEELDIAIDAVRKRIAMLELGIAQGKLLTLTRKAA